ncbi:MAG: ATP-binding protein [Clostridia bacterium]|nr:ATP-binding protein [Clostridia bacterium]
MEQLTIDAKTDNLEQVLDFVNEQIELCECSMKIQIQIDIAVEEIFVNIANYAYQDKVGKAQVQIEIKEDPLSIYITFIDSGIPYDPLAKADPDTSLKAEDRAIGGLGIFMVKKSMDNVSYQYKNGQNMLTIQKSLA